MKNIKKSLILLSICLLEGFFGKLYSSEDSSHARKCLSSMATLISEFEKLPYNRQGADSRKDSGFTSCGDKHEQWQEFNQTLDEFNRMNADKMSKDKKQSWTLSKKGSIPAKGFFDTMLSKIPFMPFVQKKLVGEGEQFYMRGDLHGDIASVVEQLKYFKDKGYLEDNFKLKQGKRFVFLGDYVDRGQYGVEVLYTLMRLKLANPDRVFMIRGNHEESCFNALFTFQKEVNHKFDDPDHTKHEKIGRLYDFLPAALYLGKKDSNTGITKYIQCCHGGLEQGYNPKRFLDDDESSYQLVDALFRKTTTQELLNNDTLSEKAKSDIQKHEQFMEDGIVLKKAVREKWPAMSTPLSEYGRPGFGLMWADFDETNRHQVSYKWNRDLAYGKEMTKALLNMSSSEKSKLTGVVRGHQHEANPNNPMMKGLVENSGVYKLWNGNERKLEDGMVLTCNVSADTNYGEQVGFDWDTMVKVDFSDGTYEPINLHPIRTEK